MGSLKKVGDATGPRSFGTGGYKITPKKTNVGSLNRENPFDKLFQIAQETTAQKIGNAPKFSLPTTSAGIVRRSETVLPAPQSTKSLDEDRVMSQKALDETRKNMRLASARANVARRSGYAVNGIDLQQEQNKLSDLRKQAQGYQKDIDRVDYVQHFQDIKQDDDFLGQFWASYDMGRLGQDEALAWNDYLNNPTPQNRRYAEAVSEQAYLYQLRNRKALDDDAILPWITQDLAGYIPQFIDQNIAGVKGLVGGAATGTVIPIIGTAVGGKIGYVAGRAAYGYDTMRGIAFKSLLDAGVDEETARAAANDEAFISSLIEGSDAAVDLLTLGGGKLIGSIFKKGAKTGAKITKPMWKKILSGGAAVLGNAAGEGVQEWTQEGVSLANQKREGSGLLNLVGATGGQIYDALSGQDPDALAQMNEAGAAGFRIGLMMGGGTKIANTALAAALNPSDQNQSGNVTLEQIADEIASDWANQTFGSYQDDSISFAQPTEQIQTQQEVPLLDRLRQQTSTLSNRQAEQVLSDRDAVATLQQKAGLDLSAQDTLAKRRSAVKQSFERYDTQQKRAETVQNNADMMNSFGENGQKAFVSEVRKTGDAAATYPEFSQAYVEGLTGAEQAADLSPTAQAAYYAGQNDAAARPKAQTTVRQAGFSESEYSGSVSEDDRSFYNALGKATGTRISVVAPTGNGGYNGYYENGEIYIAADAEDPGRVVVAHEVTHRLQEIAPEAYTRFRDYAVAAVAGQGGVDALISAYQSRYADSNVTLTQEAAMDEIAADYAQRLMIDEAAIHRVVADDRSLAQKFVDTIKDLIQRVKRVFTGRDAGAEIAQLEKARDLWLEALREGYTQKNSAVQADGEAKLSLKTLNGKQIVWIENSSLTNKELNNHKAVADFIAQHIGEVYTIVESGQKVYIGSDLPGEYTQSKYTSYLRNTDRAGARAKNKAVDGLGELIETATNRRWERTRHTQSKDAKYGMYRYDSTFAFPVKDGSGAVHRIRAYDAELLIRNASDGKKYLYDIVNIKENTDAQIDLTEREARSAAHKAATGRGVSDTSIAETGEDVNARFSLKGTSQLQRQVQNLQERNEYLKEQMRRSKSIKTDRKKTAAYAKQLAQAYESQYGADALTSDLLSIYDDIANAGSDVDMDSLTARARDIAGRVLEQSVREDTELYNEYAALRNYLRTTKINVPKSIHAYLDMMGGYNQFRKSNMGRMKLSSSDGASIDTVYQELAQQYPGLFDEAEYTNPADQLINMADVLDGIQPVLENPYSSDMEMATRFVASEILESYFDIPQQKPTFADRQQARVEAARAAGNRRVSELREANRQNIAGIREQNRERISALRASNQQRIAQLREQGRQQVKNAIQRERAKRAEQIQALKEKYASKESAGRERRAARDVRNKIQRHVRALSTRLLDPTDSRNVPDELRRPVAALLEAINLESNYTFDPDTLHEIIRKDGKSGGMTGKHLAADDARGVATERTKAFIDLRNAYQQIIKDAVGDMVIDPALLGDQAGDFQGNFDKVISMYDKRLADMSLSELETVLQTVRAVEFSISTAGKNLAQSKFAGTAEWARAMQSENAGRTQRSSTKRHWTLDLLTPITYFSRFGDSGVEVYRMLRNAQDRQQQMITDIRETTREIVSPADARKYRYETHEFVTDGGQELTLTTAQIMSIYELSKRKQAQGHLLSGGIYQPEVPGTKIRRGTEAIHLTEGDLAAIIGTLTDKQAKVADGLQKVMATTLADWGNEASMKAYGYKKFTGADYWPISVAREGVKTTVENSGMNTRSISNIGLAKATVPKASNPLNIEDAFTTFTQHAGDMTDYAAYLLPMEDASRLFNFRFKDGEGNYTGQTIKGLLNRVGGAQSDSYWTSLMDDIQNGTAARTDSQFSAGIQNIIGKAKGAAVGANLRVVVQQPTAFFRAAAVLSPADLSKGVAGAPTKGSGWAKALKWAPIAQRKQIGGFEIGNGVRLETELFGDLSQGGKRALNKLDDISSTPAAKADQITWGRLWNACEWQISKDKSLAKGSDEYYQATAKLFTRVIDESQVVDGVLQRSQIMRSNSALHKMATSFMGEPTMSLNMMMRAWDTMRYETDPKKRNALRRKFARAGAALIVSGVVNAMVQSLVDAERDKDPDKKYWDRVFSAFTGLTGEEETPWDRAVAVVLNSNVSGNINPLGQIPYVKDVLSLLQGYDVTRMDADAVGDFIKAGENVVKNISGDGPRTPAYAAKELLNAGAKVFGVSIGNLWRDASGIVNAIAVETDNTALMYEMAKASYNLSNTTNKSRFLDIAFRALSLDDLENYAYIRSELMDKMGLDGEDIASAMRSRLKEKGKEDPSFQLSQQANDLIGIHERYAPDKPPSSGFGADDLDSSAYQRYSNQSASTYRTWANEIKNTQGFKTLSDEGKDKAITMARDLAESIALRDNSGGQFTDADFTQLQRWATLGGDYGVDETEAILFEVACKMSESDKDEEGNTISGSWKENSLEEAQRLMPWLTDRELEYLISNHWTPESEALKELKKAKFLP